MASNWNLNDVSETLSGPGGGVTPGPHPNATIFGIEWKNNNDGTPAMVVNFQTPSGRHYERFTMPAEGGRGLEFKIQRIALLCKALNLSANILAGMNEDMLRQLSPQLIGRPCPIYLVDKGTTNAKGYAEYDCVPVIPSQVAGMVAGTWHPYGASAPAVAQTTPGGAGAFVQQAAPAQQAAAQVQPAQQAAVPNNGAGPYGGQVQVQTQAPQTLNADLFNQ